MPKIETDIRASLAKTAAGYLFGELESTVSNRDGSLTATIQPTMFRQFRYLVEIGRWGNLISLAQVKNSELTTYGPETFRFKALSEILRVERTRAVLKFEREFRETALERIGFAGQFATKARHTAMDAGFSAADRIYDGARSFFGEDAQPESAQPSVPYAQIFDSVKSVLKGAVQTQEPKAEHAEAPRDAEGEAEYLEVAVQQELNFDEPALILSLSEYGDVRIETIFDGVLSTEEPLDIYLEPGTAIEIYGAQRDDSGEMVKKDFFGVLALEEEGLYSLDSVLGIAQISIPEGHWAELTLSSNSLGWEIFEDDSADEPLAGEGD